MNYIPKIKYVHIITGDDNEFTFDSQPEGDPYSESITPQYAATRSNAGVRQVQFNYSIQKYDLGFKFQTLDTYNKFNKFLKEHGLRGGTFRYYPSSDEDDYKIFELDISNTRFDRPVKDKDTNDFLYDFEFSIERAVEAVIDLDTGETGVGAISETSASILNNQTVPQDITGLAFEEPDTVGIRAFFVDYTIYRASTGGGAEELSEAGQIRGTWQSISGTWNLNRSSLGDAGVNISVAANGKLQYTSSNMGGTPAVGVIRFRARTLAQDLT